MLIMSLFLDKRRYAILKAIIEQYVRTASPVASSRILNEYDFLVSAATIRNEMAFLEQLGLIESPHTSAGRVPTDVGMRLFVDQLMEEFPVHQKVRMRANRDLEGVYAGESERLIKEAVSSLTKTNNLVSFATMSWRDDYCCFGLSNLLKHQDFSDYSQMCTIMETLEDKDGFVKLIEDFDFDDGVHVLIGEENLVPAFQKSCSLVLAPYTLPNGSTGVIGVLGPKRMDYPYAVASLAAVVAEISQGSV